ncbi:MAG: glutamine amidotransferase [Bowdeniella nasicola]|nr:glutamine amidotransferase [Bowdeniella nasicola]
MKPFVLIATRAEDEAADGEYAAFLRYGQLRERELLRLRLEAEPMPTLDLDAISGIILGGSPFTGCIPVEEKSATQLRVEAELSALLDDVVARDTPLLGACYGVGSLGRHQGGIIDETYAEEISAPLMRKTEAGRTDPLLANLPDEFRSFVGHKEACRVLPPSATLLVEGDACPVQMFRVKENLYGTQFHPELDVPGIHKRIDVYREHGYFPADTAQAVKDYTAGFDVSVSHRIVTNFVAYYARD